MDTLVTLSIVLAAATWAAFRLARWVSALRSARAPAGGACTSCSGCPVSQGCGDVVPGRREPQAFVGIGPGPGPSTDG